MWVWGEGGEDERSTWCRLYRALRGRRADGLGSRLTNVTAAVTTGRPSPPAMRELGGAEPRGRRPHGRGAADGQFLCADACPPDRSWLRRGCFSEPSSAALHDRDSRCPVVGHCKCRRREDPEPRQRALTRVTSSDLQVLTRTQYQTQPLPVRGTPDAVSQSTDASSRSGASQACRLHGADLDLSHECQWQRGMQCRRSF